MYRTHTCGELRIENVGQKVTLAGWVQRSRKLGGMTFIDLRDRYGITQLVLEADADAALVETATSLGREYVIQATGEVVERQSKNPKMGTGDIEIRLEAINILNKSAVPPFTIEDESDGGEDEDEDNDAVAAPAEEWARTTAERGSAAASAGTMPISTVSAPAAARWTRAISMYLTRAWSRGSLPVRKRANAC